MKIVVATKNAHKVKELSKLMNLNGIEFVPMTEIGFDGEIEENGKTFEENAMIKAKFICDKFGVPAISDDSGICVDALLGAPGIYSARYASVDGQNSSDAENITKLLSELSKTGSNNRNASFVCAMAFCSPDNQSFTVTGKCDGYITQGVDGNGGFGYDPIFYSNDLEKTFGKATDEEKNKVSHRSRAASLMCEKLKVIYKII